MPRPTNLTLQHKDTSNVNIVDSSHSRIDIKTTDPNKLLVNLIDNNRSRINIRTPSVFFSSNYNELSNLPSINGVTLIGDKSYVDLYLAKQSVNTTEYWNGHITYVPSRGEIVVYVDKTVIGNKVYPGIKIGDGNSYVVDLPFFGEDATKMLTDLIIAHIENDEVHVTQAEKAFWNNKLNYDVVGEVLVFNRN